MEFDQHTSKSEDTASSEKKEKRKRKRRSPTRVPLHIEAMRAAEADQALKNKPAEASEKQPEKPKSKKKKRAKKSAPETVESQSVATEVDSTNPDSKTEKPPKAEASELDSKAEKPEVPASERIPQLDDEIIVPLKDDKLEGEVFVSNRLRERAASMPKPEAETAEKTDSSSREPVVERDEPQPDQPIAAETEEHSDQNEADEDDVASAKPIATPAAAQQQQTSQGAAQPRANTAAPSGQSSIKSIWNKYFPPAIPTPVRPASANLQPAQPAPAPEMYSNVRAERRNLITGIIVGGLIEHIRHKRREKRMERTHENRVKGLSESQKATETRLHKSEQKAERTKTTLERQIERLKQAVTTEVPLPFRTESSPMEAATRSEATPMPTRTTADISPSRQLESNENKKSVAEVPVQPEEQEMELPQDRRVETSVWHRIEVDKKTGKAVEDPTFAYGEEYHHEQHQERLRREIEEASLDTESVRKRYTTLTASVDQHHQLPAHATPSHETKVEKESSKLKNQTKDIAEELQFRIQQIPPIDIFLWALLGFIILAIIAVV